MQGTDLAAVPGRRAVDLSKVTLIAIRTANCDGEGDTGRGDEYSNVSCSQSNRTAREKGSSRNNCRRLASLVRPFFLARPDVILWWPLEIKKGFSEAVA